MNEWMQKRTYMLLQTRIYKMTKNKRITENNMTKFIVLFLIFFFSFFFKFQIILFKNPAI